MLGISVVVVGENRGDGIEFLWWCVVVGAKHLEREGNDLIPLQKGRLSMCFCFLFLLCKRFKRNIAFSIPTHTFT